MFGKIAFAALMVCLLGALAADAADCNYDLTNVGTQTPFDVAITIPGHHTFSDFWNNIGDGNPSVTYYTSPPPASIKSTTLHWVKRPVAPIVYGETIHVGFSLAGLRHCPPVHIKWTDRNGNPIENAYVGAAHNHLTGSVVKITNVSSLPIRVVDVRMACRATALPLAALIATNEDLVRAMVPVASGPVQLEPEQAWEIPVQVPCSQCHCVTNFKTQGAGLSAIFSPWVQEYVDFE